MRSDMGYALLSRNNQIYTGKIDGTAKFVPNNNFSGLLKNYIVLLKKKITWKI